MINIITKTTYINVSRKILTIDYVDEYSESMVLEEPELVAYQYDYKHVPCETIDVHQSIKRVSFGLDILVSYADLCLEKSYNISSILLPLCKRLATEV